MADKIFAPFALALFVVFAGFLAVYINEIDLWIVLTLVCVMAAFDFFQALRSGNGSPPA